MSPSINRTFFAMGAWLWLTATMAWSDEPWHFALEPGPAEGSLNELAEQTDLQVLYPTDLVAGVQTNAVRGSYTVREALDRLLSDTGLAANYNEQTRIIEISPAARKREEVVRLPPYTVEGENIAWRYARVGHMEVLSSCMDDATHRVIQQLFRLQEALTQIVPEDLMFASDEPLGYVLHSDRDRVGVPQEIVDKLKQHAERAASGLSTTWNIGIMNSYVFWGLDSRSIYFIINEGGIMLGRLSIRRDYLRDMLVRRTPALPAWFVEGVMELYPTVTLEPYGVETLAIGRANGHRLPGGVAKLAPFVWQSSAATYAVRKGERPTLRSMAELLDASQVAVRSSEWRAQAALFVRWALDDSAESRAGLWQLARLAAQRQVTEADFKQCLGLDFAALDKVLAKYLPKAIRHEFELRPKKFADTPEYALRVATEMDVALVKGDLDRRKIKYVERFAAPLKDRYVGQARLTLERGHGLTGDTTKLMTLLALCECDAGNDAGALPLLLEAVAHGATRPRVYYELARIRRNGWLARSQPPTAEEMAEVWQWLAAATRHRPPLEPVYDLMGEMLKLDHPPPDALRVLADGLAFFPRRVDLAKQVAAAYARLGMPGEAGAIIRRSSDLVSDARTRTELEELHRKLTRAVAD